MRNHRLTANDFGRCAHLVPRWRDPHDAQRVRLERWVNGHQLRGSTYEPSDGGAPLGVGLTAFVRGSDVRCFLDDPALPMLDHILQRAEDGSEVPLDAAGVQQARRAHDLHVMVILHRVLVADPADARAQMMFRIGAEAYWLLHGGYGVAGVWHEFPLAEEPVALAGGLEPKARVGERLVAGLERRDGPAGWPASLAQSLFVELPEQLGLTAAQRRVAELALWRIADAEIAEQLGLSEETVRRHWRDIYERMAPVLPEPAASPDATHRGPEKRRHAIDYLMKHIHEVRPPLHAEGR